MHLKGFLFSTLLGFAGGVSGAYGQEKANRPYSDPEEIWLRDPRAMARAANQALTSRERNDFCRLGRGYMEFACRVDSSGRIQSITRTALHNAAQSLPAAALSRVRESIRQHVLFSVPKAYRPDKMSSYRRMTLALPLKAFCNDNKHK